MTKKHFIALANAIRQKSTPWELSQHMVNLDTLADFCASQNSNFKRERWINYIEGKCGPNGGAR